MTKNLTKEEKERTAAIQRMSNPGDKYETVFIYHRNVAKAFAKFGSKGKDVLAGKPNP